MAVVYVPAVGHVAVAPQYVLYVVKNVVVVIIMILINIQSIIGMISDGPNIVRPAIVANVVPVAMNVVAAVCIIYYVPVFPLGR